MGVLKVLSASEQVAARLRSDLEAGLWGERIPGVLRLESELGVNRKTVESGLRLLEQQGLLLSQGPGRRRKVVVPEGGFKAPALRVSILPYEADSRKINYMLELRHQLQEAGNMADFASKTLLDLHKDTKKLASYVRGVQADAWVVVSGTREVLAWFAAQQMPVFSVFGQHRNLPLAASHPDVLSPLKVTVSRLVGLGHDRIVFMLREEHQKPHLSAFAGACLHILESHGIRTGPYNLPHWENDLEGFHRRLDALFTLTPPTAILFDGAPLFFATLHHLAQRGLSTPGDVSLVCMTTSPDFAWCVPPVTHFTWDFAPMLHRIERWAANVARGKDDRRKHLVPTKFIEGGTIGPAKK